MKISTNKIEVIIKKLSKNTKNKSILKILKINININTVNN
jgi:hypothetical protein